jgi:hypothetical protein
MSVGQDVPVQHADALIAVVVGELPVGGPVGLGIAHHLQAEQVIAGIGIAPAGLLLLPLSWLPER